MPAKSFDKIDLTGRVAVVTGGGGGLGSEYCRALAARGAAVVVNDLGGSTKGEGGSTIYADQVADEIRAAGQALANYDTVATVAGGEAIIRAAVRNSGASTSSSTMPAISAMLSSER